MTVRKLIEALLDYEMDSNVNVMVDNDSDRESVILDDVDDSVFGSEVILVADLSGYSLVDTDEYKRLLELED